MGARPEGKPQNLAVMGYSREGKEVKDESQQLYLSHQVELGLGLIHPFITALLFFHPSLIHSFH